VDKDSVFVKPIRENWSEAYYQNTAKIKANQYNSAKQSDTLPKGAYSVSFAKNWAARFCRPIPIWKWT